jgi:hypothetical protein
MPISNKRFQEHDFFLHSLRIEITTQWAASPFATVLKFFLWQSGPTFCPQPETSKPSSRACLIKAERLKKRRKN